jgi:hypothetical protein
MPPTPQSRARFLTDPVEFQRTQLRRRLWAKQREILHSTITKPLTTVKGCHASGKTFAASGLPLWWLVRYRRNSKVFVTAPTERQVKTFFKDVRVAWDAGPVKQLLPMPSTLGLNVAPDRYAYGASSSAGVNIQGLHGEHVLIICDEAPGIESDIWDAIEGIRSGGNVHVLELGNPVVPSGHFYDSHTKNRAIYNCISISAFDTPNLQNELTGAPLTEEELLSLNETRLARVHDAGLITRAWVKERHKVWGPRHPKYLSRVLGEFPGNDPYSVYPLAWIERANRAATEAESREYDRLGLPIQIGIDVAGPGSDETVLVARRGGEILGTHAFPDPDPRGPVSHLLNHYKRNMPWQLGLVVIDIAGIGYNFALHMADQGFPVYGFNAGFSAIDGTMYVNQKAETYWQFREYLRADAISGLVDEEAQAQLSTLRYRENNRGLTEIETKEQRNQRGIPGSPDRAEATIMAFMQVRPQHQERSLHGYEISPI